MTPVQEINTLVNQLILHNDEVIDSIYFMVVLERLQGLTLNLPGSKIIGDQTEEKRDEN